MRPEDISLAGKTAVVTGAGAGIGAAIAQAFASFGAWVAILDKNESRASRTAAAIRESGGDALAVAADVTRPEDVALARERVLSERGSVDVLVNNVGDFLEIVKPFLQTEEDDWSALYDVNLGQVFRCVKAFVPSMIDAGRGGSVITISSIEGYRAIPTCAVYGAFKSAIGGFVRSLAIELAPYQIKVNAIAPETTVTEQVVPDAFTKPEYRDHAEYWNPLGRWGRPDDIAGAALFLATGLSPWVTGTTIHVDGGALAAAGWYRLPGEKQRWTLAPVIKESGFTY